MRIRVVVAFLSLLLPAALSAQRLPLPGTRRPRPAEPVPLGPQPEPIARAVAYQRLRISVESYPVISYVQTSGFATGGASSWTTLGAATRAEYRLTPFNSATLDLTSSFAGGPVYLHTAELGTRIHRERSESGLDPFVDLRVGYLAANDRGLDSFGNDPFGVPATNGGYRARYSRGWGGIVGAGAEYGLTRTLSLTTALLATRFRLTSHDFLSASPTDASFTLTSLRYTLGFRYNPVRTVSR